MSKPPSNYLAPNYCKMEQFVRFSMLSSSCSLQTQFSPYPHVTPRLDLKEKSLKSRYRNSQTSLSFTVDCVLKCISFRGSLLPTFPCSFPFLGKRDSSEGVLVLGFPKDSMYSLIYNRSLSQSLLFSLKQQFLT